MVMTPLVCPVDATRLELTPRMVKPLQPELKPLALSNSEEFSAKSC